MSPVNQNSLIFGSHPTLNAPIHGSFVREAIPHLTLEELGLYTYLVEKGPFKFQAMIDHLEIPEDKARILIKCLFKKGWAYFYNIGDHS